MDYDNTLLEFHTRFLSSLNSSFSKLVISRHEKHPYYHKFRCFGTKSDGCTLPKNPGESDIILSINKTGRVAAPLSILWLRKCNHYLQICYGFTQDHYSVRRRGLNKLLRLTAIYLAYKESLSGVISTPFNGAASGPLLDKLGFRAVNSCLDNGAMSSDLRILVISTWSKDTLQRYLTNHLDTYKNSLSTIVF